MSELLLTDEEQALAQGEAGEAAKWGIKFQISVGSFFGARRLVPIRSAHVMCDGEALGEAGTRFLEEWAQQEASVRVPTTTDPRSIDPARPNALGQSSEIIGREQRIMESLRRLGAVPCHSCINYQTLDIPHFGEHLGWGDTGTVIYANSVAGARSNFEGGPAALAAALSGRVAEYGFHLDEVRRGSVLVSLDFTPRNTSEWGALGCLVGRGFPGYWQVPVFDAIERSPTPDELKHLGAALASYGSHAMFHIVGFTPEARTAAEALGGSKPSNRIVVGREDITSVFRSFPPEKDKPDVVVFGTPQLSLWELKELAEMFQGVRPRVPVLLTTSPQVRHEAEGFGYVSPLEAAGIQVLGGVCFYLMTARELARQHNFRTIVTNSAKLANIIAGYGYNPVFRSTEACVAAAATGHIPTP